MNRTHKLMILLTLMILFTTGLYAQSKQVGSSVPKMKQDHAKKVFNLLYSNDSKAADYIYWDDFYVNDEDITIFYYESVDGGYENAFKAQVVEEISKMLRTSKNKDDKYADWSFSTRGTEIESTCSNSKSVVKQWLTNPKDGIMLLLEIKISDVKK